MIIYSPVVMGPGISIKEKPSDPSHGVRLQDLQEYAVMQRIDFSEELSLSLIKRKFPSIIQVFDLNSQLVMPNVLQQSPDSEEVYIEFLEPQSGYVLIFNVGVN